MDFCKYSGYSSGTKSTSWTAVMHRYVAHAALVTSMLAFALHPPLAEAQARVQFGRVTNVVATTETSSTAQNVGAVIGGGIGLASGRGNSTSNQALRTLGGAAAGRGVGTLAGRSQAFEYTVLVDGRTTVRVISDQAGKRVGDCVAVEQGQFNNIRLVADSMCNSAAAASSERIAATESASACDQAKAMVLAAQTDADFATAERRMRLLCGE
jgi:hypothetical protein